MYDIEDHSHILFRAGERLFVCRTDESKAEEEFEGGFDLGVLSVAYSQFLTLDADARAILLSDSGSQRNLRDWLIGDAERYRVNHA